MHVGPLVPPELALGSLELRNKELGWIMDMVSGVFSLWAVVVLLIKHPHQQRDGGFCLEKGKFCAPGVFYFMSNGTAGAYRLKHHTPAGSSSSHSWIMLGVKFPVRGAEMPPFRWLVCPSVHPVRASECRNAATSWLVADLAIRGAVWMEIFQIRGQVVPPGLRATWAHLAAGSALSAQWQALWWDRAGPEAQGSLFSYFKKPADMVLPSQQVAESILNPSGQTRPFWQLHTTGLTGK